MKTIVGNVPFIEPPQWAKAHAERAQRLRRVDVRGRRARQLHEPQVHATRVRQAIDCC